MLTIAIDGPSGAGKSTIADAISAKLSILHLNTGALFRTVGLYMYENGIDPSDEEKVCSVLDKVNVEVKFLDNKQHTFLNGVDVSDRLYTSTMADYSSKVSVYGRVREHTTDIQRQIADKISVVMEGRDITSVVLPSAKYKFFVTATPEERARRRLKDLVKLGEEITFDKVLQDVLERDRRDTTRKVSPLIKTPDTILIDTEKLNESEVVDKIMSYIK